MQWLIDTILAQLVQKNNFVERVPPVSPDWELADLTPAGVFNTQDASGIVPPGTTAILCRLNAKASASGRQIFLTKEDESNWFAMAQLRLIEANRDHTEDKIVFLTNALTFKTNISTSSWTTIKLTIVGYWLGEVAQTGFQNRGDPSSFDFTTGDFTADNSWHDLDISSIVPANTSCIACHIEFYYTVQDWMVRFKTSNQVYDRNIFSAPQSTSLGFTFRDFTLPTDGLQSIAYKFDSYNFSACNLTIKGWWY